MIENVTECLFQLNVVVVKNGLASRVLSLGRESGVSGGTIMLGRGTAQNRVLKFLELADYRKEIVWSVSGGAAGRAFLRHVSETLRFDKPNSGIAFSIPVSQVLGTHHCRGELDTRGGDEHVDRKTYDSVFVVVDKGNAADVVDAATKAGARGATVINARGSGIHETSRLFSFAIEPEKEIVVILIEKSLTSLVCQSISEAVSIDDPGKGIMFVQRVDEVFGVL